MHSAELVLALLIAVAALVTIARGIEIACEEVLRDLERELDLEERRMDA